MPVDCGYHRFQQSVEMFYHKLGSELSGQFARQFFYFARDADSINLSSLANELLNYVQLLASSLKY